MTPPNDEPATFDPLELLTVADVVRLWKRSPRFVKQMVLQGKLQPVRLGKVAIPGTTGRKDYRFTRAAIQACLEAATPAPYPTLPPPVPKIHPVRPAPVPGRVFACWDGKRRV